MTYEQDEAVLEVNGLGDVAYEIAAIALLTLLYFTAGISLFARRHLRPQ